MERCSHWFCAYLTELRANMKWIFSGNLLQFCWPLNICETLFKYLNGTDVTLSMYCCVNEEISNCEAFSSVLCVSHRVESQYGLDLVGQFAPSLLTFKYLLNFFQIFKWYWCYSIALWVIALADFQLHCVLIGFVRISPSWDFFQEWFARAICSISGDFSIFGRSVWYSNGL